MQINLLSFAPTSDTVELDVYTDKAEQQYPQSVFKDECPELWKQHPELADKERLFFSVSNAATECKGEKYAVQINLLKHIRIAKHLINCNIYNHFKTIVAVGFDFVDNVEVWIKASEQPKAETTQYLKFSLAPQYKTITDGWELLLSFNGCSLVYNKSIDTLDIQAEHYKVIANGEIVKHKNITPQHKQNISAIFPIVNRELAAEFGVSENRTKTQNKYTQTYQRITDFAKQYLFIPEFQRIIAFNSTDFVTVPNDSLLEVATGSNSLLFGNNRNGFMQYNGITDNGPYQPTAKNNVRFFFIYHQNDLKVCQQLCGLFTNGIPSYTDKQTGEIKYKFPPLAQYIKQAFNTDKNGSISFSNTNTALTEIATKLNAKPLQNGYTYVAIYISPVNKDDVNNPQHDIYYKLKELLLEKGITSQAIYKDNPRGRQSDSNVATFHDYLLCYAKNQDNIELNGIPLTEEDIEDFDQIDEDGKAWRELGLRQRGSASLRTDRPEMFYPIYVNPEDCSVSLVESKSHPIPVIPKKSNGVEGRWMWGIDKFKRENIRVYARLIKRRNEFDIFIKDYLERNDEIRTKKPKSFWLEKDVNTEAGGKIVKALFGSAVFPYPKPILQGL